VTKRLAATLVVLAVALPLYADFASLARAIDSKSGVRRIWIPFLGVARFAVRIVQPEGVRDFQLATFSGTDKVDPRELQSLMREKIGPGFTPLVQVWSRKAGKKEWSFIYAKPHANDRVELVVLAHDDEETVLVRVEVDADMIARELDMPGNVRHIARGNARDEAASDARREGREARREAREARQARRE
jgi:hypothetical protein